MTDTTDDRIREAFESAPDWMGGLRAVYALALPTDAECEAWVRYSAGDYRTENLTLYGTAWDSKQQAADRATLDRFFRGGAE